MILGTSGRPMVALGGSAAWRSFTKGDIVASLQWVDISKLDDGYGDDGPQPCLALYPVNRRMETAAYLIPQEAAHKYATSSGNPTAHLFDTAIKAAFAMGFFPDQSTVHRIVDLIVDAMPDLIRMPTMAPDGLFAPAKKMGIEVTTSVNGRPVNETLV